MKKSITAADAQGILDRGDPRELEGYDSLIATTFQPFYRAYLRFRLPLRSQGIRLVELTLGGAKAFPIGPENEILLYSGAGPVDEGQKTSGGKVIEELRNGKKVDVRGWGYEKRTGMKKEFADTIGLADLEKAFLVVPVLEEEHRTAVLNSSEFTITCEYGTLLPGNGNLNYIGLGHLSPLAYFDENLAEWEVFIGNEKAHWVTYGGPKERVHEVVIEFGRIPKNSIRSGSFGKGNGILYVELSARFRPLEGGLRRFLEIPRNVPVHIYDVGDPKGSGVGAPEKKKADVFSKELGAGRIRYEGMNIRAAALGSERESILRGANLKGFLEGGEKNGEE